MRIASPAILSLACAGLLLLASVSLAGPHAPQTFPKQMGGPTLQFDDDGITATRATPGSLVAFAGVSIGSHNFMLTVDKPAALVPVDANGQARFDVPGGVNPRSVWLVVDGTSGGYTVWAPPGMVIREMDFPGAGYQTNSKGMAEKIDIDRFRVEAFFIRPGVGIWSSELEDGTAIDQDQIRNGRFTAGVGNLGVLAGNGPIPDDVQEGDRFFVVDPVSLEFAVQSLGGGR
jgi:hypothetical protein